MLKRSQEFLREDSHGQQALKNSDGDEHTYVK